MGIKHKGGEKKITTLKRFRLINSLILIVFIYIFANQIMNHYSIPTVITGISGFILGIEWLTLIITDKESKYYMKLRQGNLIEFIKIIIQEDRFRKDKDDLEIKKPEINHIGKEKEGNK